MPSSLPAKRVAACAALSKTKLDVRKSASECSWNWLRTVPARTPNVASCSSLSIKKPGRLVSLKGYRVFAARFSGICYAPASCGSNRREKGTISGGEVQIQLRVVLDRIAARVALPLDRAQVVGGDVAGDVVAVEAGGLEIGEARIGAPHRVLQLLEVLVDERVGTDLAADLLLAAVGGDQLGAGRHVDAVDVGEPHRRRRRGRSEEHTSELQSPCNLVCRLLLEKKKTKT